VISYLIFYEINLYIRFASFWVKILFNKLSLNVFRSSIFSFLRKILLFVRRNFVDVAMLVLLNTSNKYLLFVVYHYFFNN